MTGYLRADAMTQDRRFIWRCASLIGMLAGSLLLAGLWTGAQTENLFATSWKWQAAGLSLLVFITGTAAALAASWTSAFEPLLTRVGKLRVFLERLGLLNLIVVLFLVTAYLTACYFPSAFTAMPRIFDSQAVRLGLLGTLAVMALPFSYGAFRRLGAAQAGLLTFLLFGVCYQAAYYIPAVSDSPFTLSWSEGSRYYYASLFFSPSLYGMELPWPFLHPSRYLLQSLPFIIQGLPIWAHRLWQVMLWLGLSGAAAWAFTRRLNLRSRPAFWIALWWSFLFLFQGPVYYHLLVCVIPILAGFRPAKFWQSLIVILLASVWAGISRVNWFPVPALLAILLYVLEVPVTSQGSWQRYLRRPILWAAAGGAAALASHAVYIWLSRQPDPGAFGSSFTSDLLWARLLPSQTFAPGILPMMLLISAPLLVIILINASKDAYHWLRLAAGFGILTLLFLGGLVVSVKIGGGSNLHNLDAYLVMLMTWGGYLISKRFLPEGAEAQIKIPRGLLVLVILMPMLPLTQEGGSAEIQTRAQAQPELDILRQEVAAVQQGGGQVLFIWQRQLITFDEIPGAGLIPEYETVELMEMAMSRNTAYLDRFQRDLAARRFDLIVANFTHDYPRDTRRPFPEENNVWAEFISRPLLENYRSKMLLPGSMTELFVPQP